MSILRAKFRILGVLLLLLLVPTALNPYLRAQRNISGAPEIQLALRKLNTLGSVLMIAAHPDDENTALLAYFARGRALRTGYLSLTRGEGGQNLIGSEQGDELGVIRTQELLAARRIDGGEQFFTRAIDFGYTKSAEETLAKWGRENVLANIVWVIRRFQPDVIVLRFSGTPRDGHGQHQSSAILAKEAFSAAADRNQFPEQLKDTEVWQAKRIMWNVFSFTREQEQEAAAMENRVAVDTGEYNPLLGKSYEEIAGMSRSMHRSQGMGAPQRRGSSVNFLATIAGANAVQDPLDEVDTTWKRLPGGEPVGRILAEAEQTFDPHEPAKTIPILLRARLLINAMPSPWAKRKLEELDETVALCAGLWADATSDRYAATPGSSVKIETSAINRSKFAIEWSGVSLAGSDTAKTTGIQLAYNQLQKTALAWNVPSDRPYSQPIWLRTPHTGDLYTIDRQEWIGLADSPPELTAQFDVEIGGSHVTLRRPVRYRYVDSTEGELTRPLAIVPEVAVNVPVRAVLFPAEKSRRFAVELKANAAGVQGEVRLDVPAGWHIDPQSQPFRLADIGDQREVTFNVTPPPNTTEGRLVAIAVVNGKKISTGMSVISFPHIPAQTVFPQAAAKLARDDVKITAKKIGYVMGSGDQIPESLAQLGCEVTLLSRRDLAERNLAEFDAIVTGVRAYNVRPDLRANQQRLLDYVEAGGTLIVQYNTLAGFFGRSESGELAHIGPYPLTVGRARVSVEEAPVHFPDPHHPLLLSPNAISDRDFAGWIQERGLYFASAWDPHYRPVLESHDPGEKPQEGGMLYTQHGKGVYIFTAYSWFRELPAGVPGAYRMFANMLSARGAGAEARSAAVR